MSIAFFKNFSGLAGAAVNLMQGSGDTNFRALVSSNPRSSWVECPLNFPTPIFNPRERIW